MVQGGVDGVEMTHFLHPHDQEGRHNGDGELALLGLMGEDRS